MKKEPVQTKAVAEETVVFTLAVVHVADYRAGDVLQVAAHLVQSAGARAGLDEAVSAEHLPTQVIGLGAHARSVAIFTRRWVRRRSPSWADANSDSAHWAGLSKVLVMTSVGEEPRSNDRNSNNLN